ncbi:TBC-domain-containing protein [Morchella conica CCBAS932]|uniref:TBC-domain-containing protein n=1 Tax=Morchella conica CCBAS932 TaxID=1392247 RepID=A0A3N4L8X8_9PEZI|nr:TBC-domain-containing protein [Morchella conica CCBAS932]
MSSTTTGPPRRMRRFASTSVLDSNYSGAANVSTAPPHSSLRTLSNVTNQPLTTRARSHSQTAYDTKQQPGPQPGPQRFAKKAQSQANLQPKQHSTIESLISSPPASLAEALVELRYLILTEGVTADLDGNSPLRIYIWSILLGVTPMRTSDYVLLVRRGASNSYSKIRNDTFRTLATDPLFRRRVSEASLIRLLNAFQWKMKDAGVEAQYVQGMNVIAAPFLYAARSEVEAFSLFAVFIQRECPAYVRPTMEGVHRGLKLVDECLETVDPKLYRHLQEKFLTAELYAFPSVLTLSACTPPLPEVLKLWDFLLAYGAHLNILCVVAQLLLMRDELLVAQSPMKLLRQFPPLNSKTIISVAVSLVRKIPEELFEALVNHAR